ncbi:MAG: hypothetical protein ABSB69_20605, partial [Solirubrobacteraceae bacterium]
MSYANIVATMALVFAMGGGAAYAASHYLITSSKQIKPSALTEIAKKAKGAPGAPGANGAAGTGSAGPQGPAGNAGSNGSNGTNGTNGKSVAVAEEKSGGPNCKGQGGTSVEQEGSGKKLYACNGTTGFTKTLPTGMTETGTWGARFPRISEGGQK